MWRWLASSPGTQCRCRRAYQEVSKVKMNEVRRKPGKRNIRRRKNNDAGKNDSTRSVPVEEKTQPRRCRRQSDRGDAETYGDSFAAPAKSNRERLEKDAECVRHHGCKAGHDPEEPGQNHLPA